MPATKKADKKVNIFTDKSDSPDGKIKKPTTSKPKTRRSFVGKIKKMNKLLNQETENNQGMAKDVPILINEMVKFTIYMLSCKEKDLFKRRGVQTINQKDARAACLSLINEATNGFSLFGQENKCEELADDFRRRFLARDQEVLQKVKEHNEKLKKAPKKK